MVTFDSGYGSMGYHKEPPDYPAEAIQRAKTNISEEPQTLILQNYFDTVVELQKKKDEEKRLKLREKRKKNWPAAKKKKNIRLNLKL